MVSVDSKSSQPSHLLNIVDLKSGEYIQVKVLLFFTLRVPHLFRDMVLDKFERKNRINC